MSELPGEVVHYSHPSDLTEGQIDEPITKLIEELNDSEWSYTICSCSGHADSYDVFRTWNTTTMEIVMAIPESEWSTYLKWISTLREPDVEANRMAQWVTEHRRTPLLEYENWQHFLLNPGRGLDDVNYMDDEPNGWHVKKVRYDWPNVGWREHMIQLMRWAIEVVEDE